jgi:hypothetical protein
MKRRRRRKAEFLPITAVKGRPMCVTNQNATLDLTKFGEFDLLMGTKIDKSHDLIPTPNQNIILLSMRERDDLILGHILQLTHRDP